jgi:hypothetical protein
MKCRSGLSGISVAFISDVATFITCSQTALDFKLTSCLFITVCYDRHAVQKETAGQGACGRRRRSRLGQPAVIQ